MTLYLLWTKLKTLIRAQADINENNVNKISNLQIVSLSKNFFGQKTFFRKVASESAGSEVRPGNGLVSKCSGIQCPETGWTPGS